MKEKRYYMVAESVFTITTDDMGMLDGLENYKPFEGKGSSPSAFDICVESFEESCKESTGAFAGILATYAHCAIRAIPSGHAALRTRTVGSVFAAVLRTGFTDWLADARRCQGTFGGGFH